MTGRSIDVFLYFLLTFGDAKIFVHLSSEISWTTFKLRLTASVMFLTKSVIVPDPLLMQTSHEQLLLSLHPEIVCSGLVIKN